ncbi:MAG: DUF4491 family protein [Alistipes sp.]|nr:DUF4491 family protein [Alistipes sp.]MBQ3249144.1 DUF4491 family protein [Alistipes sp.]MBR3827349.1 DUF4491 family protein [Alistipes sp.]
MELHFTGLIIGIATFVIIGIFHPIVIKGEYYFGTGIWWIFLISGIVTGVCSVLVADVLWSTLLAVWAASSLWGIGELFEQKRRVERGWFPARPEGKICCKRCKGEKK